jgi:hypothetical protein
MDADAQHRPQDLRLLLEKIKPNILVQGSRSVLGFTESSTQFRRAGSLFFQILFRVLTRQRVTDPTSGMMGFDKDIAEKFGRFYPTDYPEIESLVLLIRSGSRICSEPVQMNPRKTGRSSLNPFSSLIYMFSVTLAFTACLLKHNPYLNVRSI